MEKINNCARNNCDDSHAHHDEHHHSHNDSPHHSHNDLHHHHDHKPKEKSRLLLSIIITFIFMLVEFIGGYISRSLSLISDAGHMLTHVLALGISFIAIILASRPKDDRKTYGYLRFEIIAALVNGIFVILISFYIFYIAIQRFFKPVEIHYMEMLVIAVIGLVANLIVMFLLQDASHHDLNVKGAFLHVIGDTLSSVGVIIGAIIIYFTKIYQIDAIISFVIALIILLWGIGLIRDSVNILLETTPQGISISEIRKNVLKSYKKVKDIHDIHIWELTSHNYVLTAHVSLTDCKLSLGTKEIKKITDFLKDNYGIGHATIQIECVDKSK